jgi:TPR repeat protein
MQFVSNLWGKLTTDASENSGEGARSFEEGIKLYAAGKYAAAKIQYEAAIKNGNLEARAELAWMLRYGREGVPSDLMASDRLVLKGHELRSPQCAGILSLNRTQGEMEEKVRLANIGAKAESKYGWYALGVIFNRYAPPDYKNAFKYFELAADTFDLDMAHYDLGEMYLNGKIYGVEQNKTKAFRQFQFAANQGLPQAYNKVAECYEYGNGTTKNLKKALKNYKKAQSAGILNSFLASKIRELTEQPASNLSNSRSSSSSSSSSRSSKRGKSMKTRQSRTGVKRK